MHTDREIAAPLRLLSLGLGHDEAQAPDDLELGPFLCARPDLELLECLGRGGMGVVYKARQTGLDRLVAVKVMDPRLTAEPAFATRFSKEARAMAQLDHPGIVRVIDFGEAGGSFFLLMECIDGPNLRSLMQDHEFEASAAIELVADLCDAVAYAHDRGIVHRDIKPENILVGSDGLPRLADFGLAKRLAQTEGRSEDDTVTGDTMGTPHYAAPEQLENPRRTDARADLFSLAVVLYELLTGHLPLGRFDPPAASCAIGPQLDAAIMQSLERDPEQRLPDVATLGRRLRAEAEGTASAFPDAPPPKAKRKRGHIVAALGLSAAFVGGGTWFALSPPQVATDAADSSPSSPAKAPPLEPEISAPPTAADEATTPSSSKYRPGWADYELAKMPPDSKFIVGLDAVAFFRTPFLAKRRDRLEKYGALVAPRCGGVDPLKTTNTVLIASSGDDVTMALSGNWTSDALAQCITYGFFEDGETDNQIEPYGEYRWLRTPGDAWDGLIVAADDNGHAVMTSRRLSQEQVRQRLEDPPRDSSLAHRVAERVDSSAPMWLFVEFDQPMLSYGVTAVYGYITAWDDSETHIDIHVSTEEQAAHLQTTLSTALPLLAPEQVQYTQIETHGTSVSIDGRFPNIATIEDPASHIPPQMLQQSLFLRVMFGDEE